MSEELKNIKENVMNQIHLGKAKMKPRIYFIIGSILTLIGLTISTTASIFFIGLIKFSIRAHGKMGQYKLEQMISNFPWWTLVIAITSLIIGIWLIRQYDFSYKKNLWVVIPIFILIILFSGLFIDTIGVNEKLLHRGPMKGMMRKYIEKNNFQENKEWRKR